MHGRPLLADQLGEAVRWLPKRLFAEADEAFASWRRWQLERPTGADLAPVYDWWRLQSMQLALGSTGGLQVSAAIWPDPLPPSRPQPQRPSISVSAEGPNSHLGSYLDWPVPTIILHPLAGAGTFLHELCHWLESRVAPTLADAQHAFLRSRQAGPIERLRDSSWSASTRIPAGMLNRYAECWYEPASGGQPLNFELLSTTMASLVEGGVSVCDDPRALALVLGSLVEVGR